jgi:hypothetical protein
MGVRRKLVFTFVRHGETDENAHKILQGSKHTPLNEAGREQARRLGVRLQREHESTSKGRIGSSTCTRAGTLQAQEPPFHFIFSSNNPRGPLFLRPPDLPFKISMRDFAPNAIPQIFHYHFALF